MEFFRWILVLAGAGLLVLAVLLGRRRVDEMVAVRRRAAAAAGDESDAKLAAPDIARTTFNKFDDSTEDFLSDAELDNVLPQTGSADGIEVALDISDEFDREDFTDKRGRQKARSTRGLSVKNLATAVRKATSVSEDLAPYSEAAPASADDGRSQSENTNKVSDGPTSAVSGQNQAKVPDPDVEQKIVTVHVIAPSNRRFTGPRLQSVFDTHGFAFGEMAIYHYKNEGELIFSVANMVKPGTFAPDKISNFETPGITLFMQLPVALESDVAFELMIREAHDIAKELGGQLQDANHSTLTRQTEQHMRDEIQEYTFRQKHAALA